MDETVNKNTKFDINKSHFILFIPYVFCIFIPLFLISPPIINDFELYVRLLLPSLSFILSLPIMLYLYFKRIFSSGLFFLCIFFSFLLIGTPSEHFASGINALNIVEETTEVMSFVKYEEVNKTKYHKIFIFLKDKNNNVKKQEIGKLYYDIKKLNFSDSDKLKIVYAKGFLGLVFIKEITLIKN